MLMLYRKAQEVIEHWIHKGNDALLVQGARQTGKTFLIRDILSSWGDYVEFNFIESPQLVTLFKTASSAEDLLRRFSAASGRPLNAGKTIIFLDEVQECEDVVTWIKFLVEEGSYRYILSGSLLGIELKDIRSAPVGSMQIVDMFPMDLEEFFIAIGIRQDTLDLIRKHYSDRSSIDTYIHQRLLDAYYLYLITGGMPEAVQTYVDSNDLSRVAEVHEKITRLYKLDFVKYEEKNKLKLREIYDAIPGELEEKNKRFFINHIDGKTGYDKVRDDFLWLKSAGVALPVYNVTELMNPLAVSEKRNLFKLFLSDVGLLTNRYPASVRFQLLNKERGIKNGGLFENAVAQELYAKGFHVYYYNSKRQGELDFVIELNGNVLPIEVKSGKDYKRHQALNNVINTESNRIPEAIVFHDGNVEHEGKILYLPIYMMMCIRDDMPESMIYKLDLEGI